MIVAVAVIAVLVVSYALSKQVEDHAMPETENKETRVTQTEESNDTGEDVTSGSASVLTDGKSIERTIPSGNYTFGPSISVSGKDAETAETTDASVNLPLAGAVIGIDAGHQLHGNSSTESIASDSSVKKPKVSSGTSGVSSGIPEHELNLAVALKLQALLEKEGVEVIMSRTTADIDISNKERAEMMNESGADLVIRIHANGGRASEDGAMMLVPNGHVTKLIEAASAEAGETILDRFITETGAKNLGVIPRNDMTGFNWSQVPVCLIEMGFMTNPEEDKKLSTDEYREKCAKGLATGIIEWYSEFQTKGESMEGTS
jgi:N-acetylmuramoyl-L-alanine amidase